MGYAVDVLTIWNRAGDDSWLKKEFYNPLAQHLKKENPRELCHQHTHTQGETQCLEAT